MWPSRCVTIVLLISIIGYGKGNENITSESDGSTIIFKSGNLRVEINDIIKLQIKTHNEDDNENKLTGELGAKVLLSYGKPTVELKKNELHVHWDDKISLNIKQFDRNCHKVSWVNMLDTPLEDCYDFGAMKWFGGPENIKQFWPVEKSKFVELPYITQMFENIAIAEPYWLNSESAYIYVNSTTPLFIDTHNHRKNSICFIANDVAPYLKRTKLVLDYNVCGFNDPKTAQVHAIKNFIGKPEGIPDTRMVEHPVWSTWVLYKLEVNESSVLHFAKQIVDYGFNNSQIEIDDNWESCYGSIHFNKSRFSNMKELSVKLKNLGFRITIWMHPFVNKDCLLHTELKSKNYFVKSVKGNINTVWWDGNGSAIDFTKHSTVKWFRKYHNKFMKENGIDGLKFDAGESSWLPQIPWLNCPANDHPKAYTAAYAHAISNFSSLTELRVTHRTQKYPMYVRMLDKDSKWTFKNGLPTLISTMLVMNIQGYPFVLPDMVGGNAYGKDVVTKELFLRWLQANTFMPVIQFSIPPWAFDKETVELSKKFTELHYKYSGKIIELMEKAVKTGSPVNPPIWWVDPNNPTAHEIYSEYLLGEEILVAPVIKKGAVKRNIYLPKGLWRDGNNPKTIYKGRKWLINYHADLSTLPYFIRMERNAAELLLKNSTLIFTDGVLTLP